MGLWWKGVKRSSRFEVSERLLADGRVYKELDEDAVELLQGR
jgi:N-methylhydantoinase A/oxoprolinase/acetone carboxylase beta subunit